MRETWRKERKGRSETGTVLYVSHRTGAEDRGEAFGRRRRWCRLLSFKSNKYLHTSESNRLAEERNHFPTLAF